MLESPGHGLRSQVGLLLLDVRAQRSPLDLSLGPGRHLYAVYVWYYGERKYKYMDVQLYSIHVHYLFQLTQLRIKLSKTCSNYMQCISGYIENINCIFIIPLLSMCMFAVCRNQFTIHAE
jgi:hypothetical protein